MCLQLSKSGKRALPKLSLSLSNDLLFCIIFTSYTHSISAIGVVIHTCVCNSRRYGPGTCLAGHRVHSMQRLGFGDSLSVSPILRQLTRLMFMHYPTLSLYYLHKLKWIRLYRVFSVSNLNSILVPCKMDKIIHGRSCLWYLSGETISST